jgi:serine/threonine protein kinase
VDFSRLMVISQLGEGQFGQVFLVQHEITKALYALKCIQKQQVKEMKIEKHITVFFNIKGREGCDRNVLTPAHHELH